MRVYCDHAATTPLCDEAWGAMEPFLRERFGNPSEPHAEGRAARAGLDAARAQAAEALGASEQHVVFTGGGSEADNLAVLGRLARQPGRVVTTMLEHPAVALSLSSTDAELVFAPVRTRRAWSTSPALEQLIHPGDRLCTIIWASNLTGAIQPVREIAELCAERGVPLHVDAVQAAAWLPLRLDELPGEVTAAIAAHKLHGPKGAGVLAGRGVATLAPVLHGGGQERGLRPGTESVAQASGLAAALARRVADSAIAGVTAALRDRYETALRTERSRTSRSQSEGAARLPGHSLALIGDVRARRSVALLDEQGYAVAAGAACASSRGRAERRPRRHGCTATARARCACEARSASATARLTVIVSLAPWRRCASSLRRASAAVRA